MAYKNKIISNPITNQVIKFIQTAKETKGKLLEMETTYNGRSKEPPAHYHPFQEEVFTIIKGEVTVRVQSQIMIFAEGDTFHIPANTTHSMWNNSEGKTVLNWKVTPAMNTEYLLETGMGLSQNGKVDSKTGMPGFLQVVLMAQKFSNVYRLARPSYGVQKILFAIISPISYALGYRPTYEKYLD